jgi:chromosome segregation ATPase
MSLPSQPPGDLQKLTEAFIRFSVRIDEQVKAIMQFMERFDARFSEVERDNAEDRRQIRENSHDIDELRKDLGSHCDTQEKADRRYQELSGRVGAMEPWVAGLKWALMIAGGVLVVAVVGAIIWAVGQSGAGLP